MMDEIERHTVNRPKSQDHTPFQMAYSGAVDWPGIAKQLEDRLDFATEPLPGTTRLGFIYATDALGDDLSSVLTYLRQRTGIPHWVGGVGAGICAGDREFFARPAVAVMTADLPIGSFRVLPTLKKDVGDMPDNVRTWMKSATPPFGVVHGDPMNMQITKLIEDLATEIEQTTLDLPGFLVGGLSAAMDGRPYQVSDDVTQGGLSGILFSPEVEVATGLTQGSSPIGEQHRIDECVDNIIMTLDGRPAVDVLKADVGELLARDLSRIQGYIHAAFPISGSDTGDYIVRNLMGVDLDRGWVAVAEEPIQGQSVLFVRRDPEAAAQDLVRMAENLKARLPSAPRGGLYFSCVARGPNLFGEEGRETQLINSVFGDFPLVGFYGNGEISNNRLYGYTGVLALFL